MIEADRADYNRAKLDHDLIVAITNVNRTALCCAVPCGTVD